MAISEYQPVGERFDEPDPTGLEDLEYVDTEEEDITDLDLTIKDEFSSDSLQLFLQEVGRHKIPTPQEELALAKSKDNYVPFRPTKEEKRGLSPDEVEELFLDKIAALTDDDKRLVLEGRRAFDDMIERNQRLVISIAKRYRGHGLPFLDLIQEGTIGMVRAAEKFDHTKGFRFSTYTTWWIRQAVQRAIANQANNIRVPVHVVERQAKLRKMKKELIAQNEGQEPTIDQMAERANIPLETAKEAWNVPKASVVLSKPLGGEGENELVDAIPGEAAEDPYDKAEAAMGSQDLLRAISQLEPRHRQVLELRFGLNGFDGNEHSLEEVGTELGITRERVRQLEDRALKQLGRLPSLEYLKPQDSPPKDSYGLNILPNGEGVELSTVEEAIVWGLANGLKNVEIAQKHKISKSQIGIILPIVYDKLGAKDRKSAKAIARLMVKLKNQTA